MTVNPAEMPIGYWLKRLHDLIEMTFEATLADLGLSRRHWQILNLLSETTRTRAQIEEALAPFWQEGADQRYPHRALAARLESAGRPSHDMEPGMPDYGHDLLFGTFITPTAQPVLQAVDLAIVADRAGLDLAMFQDHPYLPSFHDTWTLLSYVAARTERIRVSGNVLNLPLRQPAVLARSAASLDLLSGGRFELGIGAGGFWDAIEAMGGRRLTPGQAVAALEEAIGIIREIWAADQRGGVRFNGEYYQVNGAKRGPKPAHDIGIWVGAYKPRMLRLTGRTADGWLPSLSYLPGGLADLKDMNRHIDEAAVAAGREPSAVRRFLNIGGEFASVSRSLLNGPPDQWAEELVGMTLDYGVSGFILMSDDTRTIEIFANEVAPAARELLAAERR